MTFLLMWSQWESAPNGACCENKLTVDIWNAVFNPWWDRSTWGAKAWLAMIDEVGE